MNYIQDYNQDPEEREARMRDRYGITQERAEETLRNIAERKAKQAKNKERYPQGVFIDALPTQYGDMIKVSIHKDTFCNDNYITAGGYVSFFIKKSSKNGYYAENVKWSKK